MRQLKAKSPALLALTASALAGLGASPRAQAQAGVPVSAQADYQFSYYSESALPADRVTAGSGERYEVATHQFRVAQPFGDDNASAVSAGLTYEAMSGASPVYVQPDANGKPVDVMSGASIRDQRKDVLLGLSRHKGGTAGTLAAGYSIEDDYRAIHGSLDMSRDLDDHVTTLSAGLGYSSDTLDPEQGKWPTGTRHDTRHAGTAMVGYARVLDEVTVVQTTLSYTQHDGYLSDPYKEAWIVSAANVVSDTRPDRRGQFAWTARVRRFFKGPDAALHLDYRYYRDDWQVVAHTVDVQWHQNFGHGVRVVPGVRYYSQGAAYFYAPYYSTQRADGLASSDYRLSPYGAISANIAANWDFAADWNASLHYEHYDSSAGYALGTVAVANPGLVDFQVVSIGLKKVF